jgi:hypothetical protein
MTNRFTDALVDEGVGLLSQYIETKSTDTLRRLALIVVQLRKDSALANGLVDLSGRSPAYRHAIAEIYTRAGVPDEDLDAVQSALRYHVGNEIREQAAAEELEAVGLKPASPKQRRTTARRAVQAQQANSAKPGDIVRLTSQAVALLEYLDEDAIGGAEARDLAAARVALQRLQTRVSDLLITISDTRIGRAR